ncbi:DEAD/DEAH box helicase [Duganella dendranthematis]|jgi:hypothetical protein|uniref:DEAD/DEAH box helicase n=1 Tax=Duganella dendranthematis TaxID=2728021 RepID=A0ABX6MBJ0_9BURK|nr:helicase-related protein [Duganella dendranthematis]QJD91705.1 DEAD/DEAH box helicase [Duganella dendranthematis]
MIKQGTVPRPHELAPFQKKFIDEFLAPHSDMRLCQLAWPAGTGKTLTTAHLIQRLFAQLPEARVLAIFELDFLQQSFLATLISLDIRASVIDRYAYREMEDAALAGKPMWPGGTTYLLGKNLIAQEDILSSLCAVDWTLLVLVSADQLLVSETLLDRFSSASPNLRILALLDVANREMPAPVSRRTWSTVEFDWSEFDGMMDAAGARYSQPDVQIITTRPTRIEASMNASAATLVNLVNEPVFHSAAVAEDLVWRFKSSPIALEEGARVLRNRLAHGMPFWFPSDSAHTDSDLVKVALEQPAKANQLLLALTAYLDAIDNLPIDSKLNAFKSHVHSHIRKSGIFQHVCVFSSYSSTLRYLQTLLQEMDVPAYLLLDDVSVSERQKAIQGFIAHGGLLLGSNSLLSSGADFGYVNSLILYDLPFTKTLLNHLYGRFGRGRRVKPLSIVVFDSPNLGAFNNLNVAQAFNEMAHLAG